jgi:hypothetical protein
LCGSAPSLRSKFDPSYDRSSRNIQNDDTNGGQDGNYLLHKRKMQNNQCEFEYKSVESYAPDHRPSGKPEIAYSRLSAASKNKRHKQNKVDHAI